MVYSLKHGRFRQLVLAGFTDEDIRKVVFLLEAMDMPRDLSPLLIALTNTLNMFNEAVGILRTITDLPEDKLESIESMYVLIQKVAGIWGAASAPAKNVMRGMMEQYPICALLCNTVSASLTEKHKRALFVLSAFLLAFSYRACQKGTRNDNKSYFAENANVLRKFLGRKRDLNKPVKPLTELTTEDFVTHLAESIQGSFPELQHQFRQDIAAFLLSDSDSDQNISNESVSEGDISESENPSSSLDNDNSNGTRSGDSNNIVAPSINVAVEEDLVIGERRRYRRKRQRNLVVHDDEPAYVDTTEVTSESSDETQMSEVECAVIYGSRLDVYERQQLPFNPIVLAEHERSVLIDRLLNACDDEQALLPAAFLLITMITAKPGKYVKQLPLVKIGTTHERECIDLVNGVWNRVDVNLHKAFEPEPGQLQLLEPHSRFLSLPLPIGLLKILHALSNQISSNQFTLGDLLRTKVDCVKNYLRDFNQSEKTLYRALTVASVRNTVFHEISMETSAGQAALTLANTEFFNPSHLYYLSMEQSEIVAAWYSVLHRLKLSPSGNTVNHGVYSGSQLRAKVSFITSTIKPLYERINAFQNYQNKSSMELIEHHNNFVSYTALMIIVGTGHRVRAEYAFEYLTIDLDNKLIFIADKLHFAESATRYLPISDDIHHQLMSYLAHLRLLSKVLVKSRPELARLVSANSLAYNNTLFPLMGMIENDEWKPVGASHIMRALGDLWTLPLNAFRHLFCSRLHELGEGDFAPMLMGHVSVSESLTDSFCNSSVCDVHIFKHVASTILSELQFKAAQLEIPRGKPVAVLREHLSTDGPYIPGYLQQYQSRESDAKAIVRSVIKACINDEKTKSLSPDEFANLCRDRILAETSGARLQRTAASALFWCNRLLQRYARFKKLKLNNFRYLEKPATKGIRVDELYACGTSSLLRKKLSASLLTYVTKTDLHDAGFEFVIVSLALHQIIYVLPTEKPDQSLEFKFIASDNIAILEIRMSEENEFILLDSVSSLIALKYFQLNHWYEDKSVSKKSKKLLNNLVKMSDADGLNRDVAAVKALGNLELLHQYFVKAGDHNQTGFEKHVIAGKSITTPVGQKPLERVLFGGTSDKNEIENLGVETLDKLKYANVHKNKPDRQQDQALMQEIRSCLKMIREAPRRLNIRNALLSVWKDVVGSESDSIAALISSSDKLSPVMVACVFYLVKVAGRKGKNSDKVRVSTLTTYCSKVISPLVELHPDVAFFSLSSEDYAQIYRDILEFRNTDDPGEGARRLRDFHTTLENAFCLEPVEWGEVEPAIFVFEENVSANLITANEYNTVFESIKHNTQLDEVEKRWCSIILTLAFRLGMRLDEVVCVKIGDIDFENSLLHVRTNNLRSVKTPASNRRIPYSLLINEEEVTLLKDQVEETRRFHIGLQNMPLFCSINNSQDPKKLTFYVEFVRSTLRSVCGDGSINIHHGRHSVASWMYLLAGNVQKNGVLIDQLKGWFRTEDLKNFQSSLFKQLLGKSYSIANRPLYAIARPGREHECLNFTPLSQACC